MSQGKNNWMSDKITAIYFNACQRCAKALDYYNEYWYCLPCEIECPTQALTLEIPFLVS